MKKRNTILLLLVALLVTSCSDWLNVSPDNQVNEKDMFSSGDGYRSALNGIYLNLSGNTMYGKELTWGLMGVLSQDYLAESSFLKPENAYSKASKYQYDDKTVKAMISSIWSTGYNNIANCNNLISKVSVENPRLFARNEAEKSVIWGEALALRGFMHFEALRMFAPSMLKDDKKPHIPYMNVYPNTAPSYFTNTEIIDKIEKDLTQAKNLLATFDTIPENRDLLTTHERMYGGQNTIVDDVFYIYRGFRMNYYAITGMLARLYCWAGRYEEAYKQAQEVIDAVNPEEESPYFGFSVSNILSSNPKDPESLLLAFSNTVVSETYAPYINKGGQSDMLVLNADRIFENSKEDERGIGLTGSVVGYKYSNKYNILKGSKGSDMLPILRLSEMYYIVGEYHARNNDFEKAGVALDRVRFARGILSKKLNITSLEEFEKELLKEAQKEFIGEGQSFYHYKRLDRKPVDEANFVFNRPDNEDV